MREARINRPTTVVWFRSDLRVHDQPALAFAAARGAVLPVFVWDDDPALPWRPRGASRWWCRQSLLALAAELARRGARLIVRRGPTVPALLEIAVRAKADAVAFESSLWPGERALEERLRTALAGAGIRAVGFPANLLWDPRSVSNQQGGPYRVFTAFYRKVVPLRVPAPRPAPAQLHAPAVWPDGDPLESLPGEPAYRWAECWQPGEQAARRRIDDFCSEQLTEYSERRDSLEPPGTSLLSPHLRFGEISVRELWSRVSAWVKEANPAGIESARSFLRQLVWREFAYHTLWHSPHIATESIDRRFVNFEWEDDAQALAAWQQGATGYPLVDAGMRQLRETGFLPNRARMVVGSLLTKHLLLPWQQGAGWFWEALVDADLANNSLNWQWVAGVGVDPMPFVRIFDPVRQGQRFDPDGTYVRRWVPELAKLPRQWIHCPWRAPAEVLAKAALRLGTDYPTPIVDASVARKRALVRYAALRTRAPSER